MEGKREDRRIRRTKRLLIQALTKLMQQKQVNEITVKELTDLADINRGTFYLYYKDIFDMLEKIENELFGKLEGIRSAERRNRRAAGRRGTALRRVPGARRRCWAAGRRYRRLARRREPVVRRHERVEGWIG